MTSHSARLLTSYYGDMSRLSGLIWPKKHKKLSNWMEIYTTDLQFKQTFTNFWRRHVIFWSFQVFFNDNFYGVFSRACSYLVPSFCFWSKGEEHQGISLIFTRSEAPVFRTFFWTFLVVSSSIWRICSTAAFSVVVKAESVSLLLGEWQHLWRFVTLATTGACVYTLLPKWTQKFFSLLELQQSPPSSFYFMECQILTQLAVY